MLLQFDQARENGTDVFLRLELEGHEKLFEELFVPRSHFHSHEALAAMHCEGAVSLLSSPPLKH